MEEMVDPAFWRGKRVFVTGHTGFKGGWLCAWLQELGADVTGFALPPEHPSLFEEARIGIGMQSLLGDIRCFDPIQEALGATRPEVVFHLAAQALVRRAYAHPVETFATNVLGTVHLLEAVRATGGVRAVVNITSDKCYENRRWVWGYRECDSLGGCDPYSASKAGAELAVHAYRESYFPVETFEAHGVAVASARAGNVIGGGDWAENRLIPDVLRALSKSQPVQIRYPQAIRPWQHVLEPLSGYLLLAERLYTSGSRFADAWNFGPSHDGVRPVSWVVEALLSRCGGGAGWSSDTGAHPPEERHLRLDCTKAIANLGWRPRWGLDKALDATWAWHCAHTAGQDMRDVTVQQIREYAATPPHIVM